MVNGYTESISIKTKFVEEEIVDRIEDIYVMYTFSRLKNQLAINKRKYYDQKD